MLSQHGACRPAARELRLSSLLPLLLFSLSLCSPSISSPCLFPSVLSRLPHSALFICSYSLSAELQSALLSFLLFSFPPLLFFPNKRTAAGYCSSRGSSAMCSWSKLHKEAPWVASHATELRRVLHLACDGTGWWWGWGIRICCWLTWWYAQPQYDFITLPHHMHM